MSQKYPLAIPPLPRCNTYRSKNKNDASKSADFVASEIVIGQLSESLNRCSRSRFK